MFDIGEANGQPYISMEYVDGEDLGALLRRIGRLPNEKAVELARKLCAGLAAAHGKGVLHRDLKPANIMIDNRGEVIIMDFGLAGVASQLQGAELRHGTPAYMAPEQLAGKEVSTLSDVYALGLVLYEMITGRRAFEAASLGELIRLREHSTPISWSRALDGRFGDTLVCNRILSGITAGVAAALLLNAGTLADIRAGGQPTGFVALSTMMGAPQVAAYLLNSLPVSIAAALGQFLAFFLLRVLVRREWLAGLVFVTLFTALASLGSAFSPSAIVVRALLDALTVVLLLRFGLLPLVVMTAVSALLLNFPITANLSTWYAGNGLFALALVAGLAIYAFRTALGGRTLFQDDVFG